MTKALRYSADRERLGPELGPRFCELSCDASATDFIERSRRERHGRGRTWLQRAVRLFVSDFDANGLLGMYPMHLGSTEQWQRLLGAGKVASLLDIGAGSGSVTETLLPLCESVLATETSRPMVRQLERRGIACRRVDLALEGLGDERTFQLVTCLNVLDRAPHPKRLLARAVERIAPGGRLLLALALPYQPFFYDGASTPEPREPLGVQARDWEPAVRELVQRELLPLGLHVLTLTRLPYLSFGDAERELYTLDDVVVVASRHGPA